MLDRDLSTLVTNVIRRRIMRGDREPDIDLEAGPMSGACGSERSPLRDKP
jgi:hypothetical protein